MLCVLFFILNRIMMFPLINLHQISLFYKQEYFVKLLQYTYVITTKKPF